MLERIAQKYRYSLILLRELVATDFKLRYQGSVLGYIWSLLRPMALFIILYFVFSRLGTSAGLPHFDVYLFLGILVWNYFSEVTNNSVGSIVGRGDLLRKINFPKYVIVFAGSFSALINLFINLLVFFGFMIFLGASPQLDALWVIPLLILQLFVLSLALAFLLSALYVKFRDVNYIWEVIMQGAFYATPILYALSYMPEKVQAILILNPVAQIIQDMREVLVTDKTLTIGEVYHDEWVRLITVGITIVLALGAAYYFKKRSRYFAEEV
jgi:ABC-2 type transport system permease protein